MAAVNLSRSVLGKRTAVLFGTLAVLAGGFIAYLRFGFAVLNPQDVHWLAGDAVWHYLAWSFFRQEPWQLPPGQMTNFLYPVGTSIGGSDAVPLLAFPAKLLSSYLPQVFQYFGFWLYLNGVLQALFGYLLLLQQRKQPALAFLGSLLFCLSPVFLFREAHIALSSQWLILWALLLYLRGAGVVSVSRWPAYVLQWLLLIALAGLIHPYLVAMTLPVAAVSLWRARALSGFSLLQWGLLGTGVLGILGLEWWAAGLIGLGRGGGFNYYTWNINGFFNPQGRSSLLPSWPTGPGQYEGFAYLGLGMLGLSGLWGALSLRSPRRFGLAAQSVTKRHGLLLVLLAAFSIFSLGDKALLRFCALGFAALLLLALLLRVIFPSRKRWHLNREALGLLALLALGCLLASSQSVRASFRAPGRFIWLPYYVIYLGLLSWALRRLRTRAAALLLVVALGVQLADLRYTPLYEAGQLSFKENLPSPRWQKVLEPYDTLVVIPPFVKSVGGEKDFRDFAFLASQQHKRVTTGVFARRPENLAAVSRSLVQEALGQGRDPKALYVFSAKDFAARFAKDFAPGARCEPLDAYVLCHKVVP